jgi:hypothetical protein
MSSRENSFLKYCVKSVELSHTCQESANNVTKYSAKHARLLCKEMAIFFKMMLFSSKLSNLKDRMLKLMEIIKLDELKQCDILP